MSFIEEQKMRFEWLKQEHEFTNKQIAAWSEADQKIVAVMGTLVVGIIGLSTSQYVPSKGNATSYLLFLAAALMTLAVIQSSLYSSLILLMAERKAQLARRTAEFLSVEPDLALTLYGPYRSESLASYEVGVAPYLAVRGLFGLVISVSGMAVDNIDYNDGKLVACFLGSVLFFVGTYVTANHALAFRKFANRLRTEASRYDKKQPVLDSLSLKEPGSVRCDRVRRRSPGKKSQNLRETSGSVSVAAVSDWRPADRGSATDHDSALSVPVDKARAAECGPCDLRGAASDTGAVHGLRKIASGHPDLARLAENSEQCGHGIRRRRARGWPGTWVSIGPRGGFPLDKLVDPGNQSVEPGGQVGHVRSQRGWPCHLRGLGLRRHATGSEVCPSRLYIHVARRTSVVECGLPDGAMHLGRDIDHHLVLAPGRPLGATLFPMLHDLRLADIDSLLLTISSPRTAPRPATSCCHTVMTA